MTGSVVMMPYQIYQLYQAERPKTAAEIRRADEQLGELSRAFSWAWQHATQPHAALRGGRRRRITGPLATVHPAPRAASR
jgi:hypothetical protein